MSGGAALPPLPTVVAIDGPAGAGKSTVGACVARRLGYAFFDTGVLYRAVTLAAVRSGVDPQDEAALTKLAEALDIRILPPTVEDGRQSTILLSGEDVTWALRQAEVTQTVSLVSAHPRVRAALLGQQRAIGQQGRVVVVGRDIGTVVLPTAGLKVYLDASPEERARRRQLEQQQRGEPADFATVLAGVRQRDELDSQRAASPLRPADDAICLPTDGMSIKEVVDAIVSLFAERAGALVGE